MVRPLSASASRPNVMIALVILALGFGIVAAGCSKKRGPAAGGGSSLTVEKLQGYYRTKGKGSGDDHQFIEITPEGALSVGNRIGESELSISHTYEFRGEEIVVQSAGSVTINNKTYKPDPEILRVSG